MKYSKLTVVPVVVSLFCALLQPARAQWIQNSSVGPFNYTDTANWNGGIINNQFLTNVTTGLTINFPADYTLTSQVLLGWSNNAVVTFQSSSGTAHTIKFVANSGFAVTNSVGGTITIGGTNNPLILDLNGATNCNLGGVAGTSGTANTIMNVNAQIIDSSGGTNGIKLAGDRVFTFLLNTNNSFTGPANYYALRGGGFASIKNIGAGPSALGAPTDSTNGTISAADNNSNGALRYTGSGDTSDRPFVWNVGFSNAIAAAYQFANAGTGLLKLTGQMSFPTNGTLNSQFIINATNAPIELDGYIHGSGNSNGTFTFIDFQGGPTSTATNRIILTGPTNDFRDFMISNVVLNYNSVAPAGVPSSVGAGTNIVLGGGSGGNANWPGTSGQGSSLQYVGPSTNFTRNLQFNIANSQTYWGMENAGTNTTLTLSNNIIWSVSAGVLTGFQPRYLLLNVNNAATNAVMSLIPDPGIMINTTPIGMLVAAGCPVGFTIQNGGMLQLLNPSNTFAGGVQAAYARTIQAVNLANIGQPSSIGTGQNPGNMISPSMPLTGINLGSTDSQRGGILSYIGTNNAASNQRITILGSTGTLCGGTIRNDSPNGSSLHLTDPGVWNLDTVMPFCLATLGGTAAVTNTLDSIITDVNAVSGSGSLLVNGSAWRLTANHSYSGTSSVATATLIVNGSIASGLGATVAGGGVLAGTGTINEFVNVLANGTIAAGDGAVGALTVNGNLTNNGTVFMKLDKGNGTNDQLLLGANTLAYGGVLMVTNLTGTLATNDSFHLFTAGTYTGAFTAISPATPPGNNLAWDLSSLTNNGTLKVVAGGSPNPPTITSFSIAGGNLTLNGTNGTANGTYQVRGTTNVALPMIQWTNAGSNVFDGSGNFSFTVSNAVQPGIPKQFFRLQMP